MRHRSATLLPPLLLVVPLALPPRAQAAPARTRAALPAASAALAAPSFPLLFRLLSNLGLGDWDHGGDGHGGHDGPPHDPPPHDPPEGSGLCPHGEH